MDNKVSEKAIWEGAITPDSDTPSLASQIPQQPQMMFCYKCNNVIPSNSKFCPCCNVVLFATCPKCGVKYSSQYLICNQCGTNREEYIQVQRREQARKEAIERENRRQTEILERKRLEVERRRKEAEAEKERQERLKKHEQEASERLQKEIYLKENAEIKKTKEYQTTYSLLNDAFVTCDSKNKQIFLFITFLCGVGYIWGFLNTNEELEGLANLYILIGFPLLLILCAIFGSDKKKEKFLLQYTYRNNCCDKDFITNSFIKMVCYQGIERLEDCCIIAYREKHGLTINYKWHNLRRD